MRSLLFFSMLACSTNGLPTTGGTTGGTTTGGTTGGPPSNPCGGGLKGCPSDEYCVFPVGDVCGAMGTLGTCAARPQLCDNVAMPVCGCDGVTYANACYANAAGVDVAASGECVTPVPGSCGGIAGSACAPNEYCYYPPGQMCDWADGTGHCAVRPDACSDIYDPVCGCDNMTYGSECDAALAGIGVAYKGVCGGTDCQTTGCPAGQQCQLCWANYQCLPPNVAC